MKTKQHKHERYTESKERFAKLTEGKRWGYINWETYLDNSKLECWNIKEEDGTVQPHIFQFWPDGNGYSEYKPC